MVVVPYLIISLQYEAPILHLDRKQRTAHCIMTTARFSIILLNGLCLPHCSHLLLAAMVYLATYRIHVRFHAIIDVAFSPTHMFFALFLIGVAFIQIIYVPVARFMTRPSLL